VSAYTGVINFYDPIFWPTVDKPMQQDANDITILELETSL